MKSLTEIKDKIAQQHGYKDFMDVLKSFDCAKSTYAEVNFIINEAMQEYVKQREIEIGVFLVDKGHFKAAIDLIKFTPNVAEKP